MLLYLTLLFSFYVLFDLISSLAAETAAVLMRVLRTYATCRTHDVAYRGLGAILSVAWSDQAIQQRFVAAGAREVVEAFRDDPATSTKAMKKACRTLEQLTLAGGCEGGWVGTPPGALAAFIIFIHCWR